MLDVLLPPYQPTPVKELDEFSGLLFVNTDIIQPVDLPKLSSDTGPS